MKRRLYDIKGILLFALTFVLMLSGCVEFIEPDMASGEYLTFRVALDQREQGLRTRSISEYFTIEEEDWPLTLTREDPQTKASLINTLNGYNKQEGGPSAGVFGYVGTSLWQEVKNVGYTFDGDEMITSAPPRWSTLPENEGEENVKIYAYAPYIETQTSNIINISNVAGEQKDYIVAASQEISVASTKFETVQLDFEHIYTAIQLKAGFDCEISSIIISGIRTSGSYTIGDGWTLAENETSYEITPQTHLTVKKGDKIGEPVFMIPQNLSDNAKLSVVTNEGTFSVSLKGKEWEQGKLVTYTLNKKGDDNYVYFDLAAGNVTVNASTYTGYVFVNGQTEAKPISGTHKSGNKYYVYQSCVTETNKSKVNNYMVGYSGYDSETKQVTGTLTLPS